MRILIALMALALLDVALFLLGLALGSHTIPLREVLIVLGGGEPSFPPWSFIVMDLRLPRGMAACGAGSALAVSGLLMQTLFGNPLAGPYVLGVSSGASLGVAILVLGAGPLFVQTSGAGEFAHILAAGCGAAAVMLLVVLASKRVGNNITLLILGLMFGYFSGAIVSMLSYLTTAEQLQTFTLWSLGTFAHLTWSKMWIFVPVLALGLLLSMSLARPLNVLLMGEEYAASMGIRVRWCRALIITAACLLAGTVTAFCGPIAFIGIAVPHLCRRIFQTANHTLLLPACMLCGAGLALICDLVARLPGSDRTLPLAPVTSVIGVPLVVWVILRRRRAASP